MKVAVWDTYVTKKDGSVMHFDIIAPSELKDETIIYNYGKEYLNLKNQGGQNLTAKECNFCHIENVKEEMVSAIAEKGYYIIEMQGCN
jgi:membrane protease subunit (stomatin/prohibitin family)